MNFYIFVFLTALAVSIDSMLAGFAFGLKSKKATLFATVVSLTTLLVCFVATIFGKLFVGVSPQTIKIIGSGLLVLVGVLNVFNKKEENITKINPKEVLTISFAVSLDGGIANLSIFMLGHTQWWLPFVFALTHFLTVYVGVKLAGTKLTTKLKHANLFCGIVLVVLGVMKFFGS